MATVEAPGGENEVDAAPARPIVALAKQTLVYGIGGVVLQLVGVVTLPIFARAFTPAEFGVLELGLVASWVALALADAGFASASQRSFFDYGDEQKEARRAVLLTALVSTLVVACALAGVLLATRAELSDWLFGGEDGADVIALVAAAIPVTIAANFLREILRLHFRPWHYVTSAALGAACAGAAGVLAVVVFDGGVEGVFLGVLIGNAVAVAYGAAAAGRFLGGSFSRAELHTMLAFGLPLVPTALAMWALTFVDRVMLAKLGDLDDVGQYGVAGRISGVLALAIVGFQLALSPYLFSIYSRDREVEKIVRGHVLTYLTVALCFGGLGLTLFSPELIQLAAPDYDRAYLAVAPLTLGVVGFGMATLLASGISLARKTTFFALGSGLATVVNVSANLALIPLFGMVGAAVASAIAFCFLAALYYVVGQRVYPTPYEPRKALLTVAVAAALATLVALPLPLALGVVVKLAALAAYIPVLRIAGVLTARDFAEARIVARGALARVRRLPPDVPSAP